MRSKMASGCALFGPCRETRQYALLRITFDLLSALLRVRIDPDIGLAPQKQSGHRLIQSLIVMYAIKTEVNDPAAGSWVFEAQKTMYGGKQISAGDEIFVFASENEGGSGLIARGVVLSAEPVPRKVNVVRQTPRVSITVKRTKMTKQPLGRVELRSFSDWNDGRPETELNFKFYRQATNKIISLSEVSANFLASHF